MVTIAIRVLDVVARSEAYAMCQSFGNFSKADPVYLSGLLFEADEPIDRALNI